MMGRKMQLFVTDLSFLGWLVLAGLIVSLVYQLALMILPMTVADLLSLAVNIVISMFLSAYMSLTVAGFYLFALGNQAPPVQNQGGDFNQWNQYPPHNPTAGTMGWNQQPPEPLRRRRGLEPVSLWECRSGHSQFFGNMVDFAS